ncbi:MAG: general secretion pathway protein GspK, partial [Candidatus Hydrogenedens sp.]
MRTMLNRIQESFYKSNRKGVALMIAISLLGVFALLGMYYIRDAETELRRTALLLDEMRVREYAKTGISSALVELEKAWRTDTLQELLDKCPLEFSYPYYKQEYKGNGTFALEPSDTISVNVKVWITDESGKINLNCSPASVLQKILNTNGEIARRIVTNLPNSGMASSSGRWFYIVEELYGTNGFIPEEFNGQVTNFVSTWNAGNPAHPVPYLNVNKAPIEVLMALFNISSDDAQKIVNARPIKSMNDLITILGKPTTGYNIKVDDVSLNWQFPFTEKSNSFKIVAVAELSRITLGKKYNYVFASKEA